MKAVILCAGKGSRLCTCYHKLLAVVAGKTVLERLCTNLEAIGVKTKDITFVVGYEAAILKEQLPQDATFIENTLWQHTNTAKSAYLGLQNVNNSDVLLINGDIVADLACFASIASAKQTCALTTIAAVGDEEMKYVLNANGTLGWIAKDLVPSRTLGEFCGVTKIIKDDIQTVLTKLENLPSDSYYDGVFCEIKTYPVFTLGRRFIEIDYAHDLKRANKLFGGTNDD